MTPDLMEDRALALAAHEAKVAAAGGGARWEGGFGRPMAHGVPDFAQGVALYSDQALEPSSAIEVILMVPYEISLTKMIAVKVPAEVLRVESSEGSGHQRIAARLRAVPAVSLPPRPGLVASLALVPRWREEARQRRALVRELAVPALAGKDVSRSERRHLGRVVRETARLASEPVRATARDSLLRTGWLLLTYAPDRRRRDRRRFPRATNDRRRWWTDGVEPEAGDPAKERRRQVSGSES